MATTQELRWLIEGQLAGAKRALHVADMAFELSPEGRVDDQAIAKMLTCLEELHRAITHIDTRLQRLEGDTDGQALVQPKRQAADDQRPLGTTVESVQAP